VKTNRAVKITILLFVLSGCTPMPMKTWTSSPVNQTAQNPYYEVQFEPLKQNNNFFEIFRITVENKTDNNLEIDWNKTRYIFNGRARGVFVFKGINPEDIKNLTIPADTVPPGTKFSKEISPAKLVAFAPIRDRTDSAAKSGFSPGVIPEGENGIYLVIRTFEQEMRDNITLNIESKEIR
jgi:hypothetical protein